MSHRELPETPEIEEDIVDVFDDFITKKLLDVHTCLPGRILTYEGHATRKAQVEISVHMPSINGEFMKANPISNVPVVFQSSSTTNILFPLKPGDGCMLLFSEAGIGNFMNGEVTVNADDFSRFDTTDCICIPGLWSTPTIPVPAVVINEEAFQIIHGENNIVLSEESILLQRGDMALELLPDGKISINGVTEELITLLSEVIQTLSSATIITGIGPQPFTPTSIADFTALQTRLDTLKV